VVIATSAASRRGDQHAADARDIVARIKSVPTRQRVGLEQAAKSIARRDRHADIAQITRADRAGMFMQPTEGDGEVSIVPADAGAIAVGFPGRLVGARVFIAKAMCW